MATNIGHLTLFCGAQLGAIQRLAEVQTMTSAMTAFGIAVGGTSLICYALMTRLQNRRGNRRSSGDNASADGGNYVGGGGRTIAHWFGGGHSGLDSSGNPSDTNGSDSGGGGSEGGGGGRGDGAGGGD